MLANKLFREISQILIFQLMRQNINFSSLPTREQVKEDTKREWVQWLRLKHSSQEWWRKGRLKDLNISATSIVVRKWMELHDGGGHLQYTDFFPQSCYWTNNYFSDLRALSRKAEMVIPWNKALLVVETED